MPVPEGYFTKTNAYKYIHERTGYGRMVIDNAMDGLEAAGKIRYLPHPGNKLAKLLSKEDIERVITALTIIGSVPEEAQP